MNNSKVLWITRTAIMLALLLILQFVTKALGQIVTGSCVNFILIMALLLVGLSSGITIAIISPFFAYMLGIGPAFLPIVPCIAIGNVLLVLVSSLLLALFNGCKKDEKGRMACKRKGCPITMIVSVVIGAFSKFVALYLLIVRLVLPTLGLPDAKVNAMSAMFTWPQLVTALIGGIVATIIAIPVNKSLAKQK